MSDYHLLRKLCGLSHGEAAAYLKVPLDTAKSWDSGRRTPPAGAVAELRALAERIRVAAEQALDMLDTQQPPAAVVGRCSDDYEARSLGWPCRAAHDMVLARILAEVMPPTVVRIVPRGSEPATAAAADAHERVLPTR